MMNKAAKAQEDNTKKQSFKQNKTKAILRLPFRKKVSLVDHYRASARRNKYGSR
jgi:hypothetical protein